MPDTAEQRRLAALERLRLLDDRAEESFDRITALAARLFGVSIACIHVLDEGRQWVKAAFGNHLGNLPRDQTICRHVLQDGDMLVIPDTTKDPRSRELWYVTGDPGIRFYASAPLRSAENEIVGTLCLLDTKPVSALDRQQAELLRELANLVTEIMELRVAHRQAHSAVASVLERDTLTDLFSFRGATARLRRMLETGTKPEAVVLQLRLDRIETVQRAHGSAIRDLVLRQAAERIVDTGDGGEIRARSEAGTFLVIHGFPATGRSLPHAAGGASNWADTRAATLLARMREPFITETEVFHLTASIGIARCPEDAQTALHLLDAADEAAGSAQDTGGDRMVWHHADRPAGQRHRLSIETRLRRALDDDGLAVAFQPVVTLADDGRVVGAEALARWPQNDGNHIGPGVFIPIAEAAGLIEPINQRVFELACRQLAQWRGGGRDLWISVNISPTQLSNPGLAASLVGIAERAGVAPRALKIEITEGALTENEPTANRILAALREAGFTLALDDFGTGHSSLARLLRLPFQVLKVDRSLVVDCPHGPGATAVSGLAGIARNLGIQALGEGVETQAHEAFLRSNGYHLAQGYLYAPALAPAEFIAHCDARD